MTYVALCLADNSPCTSSGQCAGAHHPYCIRISKIDYALTLDAPNLASTEDLWHNLLKSLPLHTADDACARTRRLRRGAVVHQRHLPVVVKLSRLRGKILDASE